MAGFFDKNKDYSLAIRKARKRGASAAELDRLRRERQNKIDAAYGGNDPYRGHADIMGRRDRDRDRETLLQGGQLYHEDGRPAVHLGSTWDPNTDYAAQARHYARLGDWDAVDELLRRRQAKIDGQGGNDRGLSNRELWDRLRSGQGLETVPGGGYHGSPQSYLEELFHQRQSETEARLRAQYEQDAAGIRAQQEAMERFYADLRNRQAARSELERMRLNELGAAHGLNTGTFGQLSLGAGLAAQSAFADLGRREAADRRDSGWKLHQLESAYRGAVEEARARSEAELMDKLYGEYVRRTETEARRRREEQEAQRRAQQVRESAEREARRKAEDRARTLARHGDFSGYAKLGYSREEIAAMRREWERKNLK